MIDIKAENERNLKNVRQMGSPTGDDKIYIENTAYERIHAEDFAERRAFIFMGHTECENNHYTTFVESAIPVQNIDFQQNVPQWNSHAWSDVFQEVKRSYDNSIIVGWAMDIKGFPPRLTPELEVVHREQFGGAHQVLFLMDSIEGEEHFYINKGNCLQQKDGFFIYYAAKPEKAPEADVTVEVPEETPLRNGKSRLLMEGGQQKKQAKEPKKEKREQEEKSGGHRAYSYAMTAAILLLIGLVGLGVYQDRIKLSDLEEAVSTMVSRQEKTEDAEVLVGTEPGETEGISASTETLNLIPVETLPSGEIPTVEDSEEQGQPESTASDAEDGTDGADADGTNNTSQAEDGTADDNADSANASQEETADTGAATSGYYIVKQGDTLTGISKKYYGSTAYIEKIAELNNLEDTDDIRVGQKLLLP